MANKAGAVAAGFGGRALGNPRTWSKLRNPFKPSWGEPYVSIASRMLAAVEDSSASRQWQEIPS